MPGLLVVGNVADLLVVLVGQIVHVIAVAVRDVQVPVGTEQNLPERQRVVVQILLLGGGGNQRAVRAVQRRLEGGVLRLNDIQGAKNVHVDSEGSQRFVQRRDRAGGVGHVLYLLLDAIQRCLRQGQPLLLKQNNTRQVLLGSVQNQLARVFVIAGAVDRHDLIPEAVLADRVAVGRQVPLDACHQQLYHVFGYLLTVQLQKRLAEVGGGTPGQGARAERRQQGGTQEQRRQGAAWRESFH